MPPEPVATMRLFMWFLVIGRSWGLGAVRKWYRKGRKGRTQGSPRGWPDHNDVVRWVLGARLADHDYTSGALTCAGRLYRDPVRTCSQGMRHSKQASAPAIGARFHQST